MSAPRGHAPIRVYSERGALMLDWCAVDWPRAVEPFFEQTVDRELRLPFNLVFRPQTPASALLEQQARDPAPPPAGLIFHMSRCGSTLLARMLQLSEGCRVVAEPGAVAMLLHHTAAWPAEQRAELLRALVGAFGRDAPAYVVKLDSWAAADLGLFQRAFPDTPWVFVCRDPLEVLVSQMLAPAPALLDRRDLAPRIGLDPLAAAALPIEELCARALGFCCRRALEQLGQGGRLLHYRDLPDAAFALAQRWLGRPWGPREQAHARRAAGFHAKQPAESFADDTAAKRRAATPAMREAVERWARAPYEALVAAQPGNADIPEAQR